MSQDGQSRPLGSTGRIRSWSMMQGLQTQEMVLCGDLGGTNSRLVLFEVTGAGATTPTAAITQVGNQYPAFKKTYKNADFVTFNEIVHTFIAESSINELTIVAGCLAVAGPVEVSRTPRPHALHRSM